MPEKVFLTHGAERGLIHDLNSNRIFSINSEAKYYLDKLLKGNTIEDVLFEMNEDYKNKFIQYINLLIENNLGYYSKEKIFSGQYIKEKQINKKLSTVWFELRKACNLKCCHCYMDSGSNSDSTLNVLGIDEWKAVINQLKEFKPKNIILIGGEPLLFKDIIKLIEYIRSECTDSRIILYSNLTLLTEKLEECILNNEVKVSTSIYSHDAEIHDKITGKKGSFDKTTSNLIRLRNLNVDVKANSVIMKYNHQQMSDIKDYIFKITGKYGNMDVIRDIGSTKEGLLPTEFSKKCSRVKNKADFKLINEGQFFRNYSGNSCWQGKINITSDGNISPCIMGSSLLNKSYNVRTHTLEKIINNYITPEFWALSKDYVEVCKDCEYRYVCSDCRPMCIQDGNKYLKDRLCGYNPYIGQWENEP